MLILKDQKSLDVIEGKTNTSNKTEIQKDSHCKELTLAGVVPGKSQKAVLLLYSIIFLCTVSKLKPKQYKSS